MSGRFKTIQARLGKAFPLPGWCFGCQTFLPRATPPWLCRNCIQKLPHWQEGICLACGHVHHLSDCQEDWTLVLDHFHAVFAYVDPIREWLSRFKYGGNLNGGRILKALLANYFNQHPQLLESVDLILPVPSHPKKLVQRGLNVPAYLLDLPGLSPTNGAAKKIKETSSQAGLHSKERQRNLSRAFAANPAEVEGKSVLLFDDVCTTGATLEELALTLKRTGANSVGAWVLARAVKGGA